MVPKAPSLSEKHWWTTRNCRCLHAGSRTNPKLAGSDSQSGGRQISTLVLTFGGGRAKVAMLLIHEPMGRGFGSSVKRSNGYASSARTASVGQSNLGSREARKEVEASMARGAKDDVSTRALESSGRFDSLHGRHALTVAGDPNETARWKARSHMG
jgi:hypothetical protein